ncbi:carboxymuconolactone decarboxylase family protein [Streptomyces sp. NPDC048565]|uniref:carboxymuconolactone decarboxylase family protein n=1 Tax=Streptomyces sp. NPDC048565 TaxID=3155266 RepID=UPI00342CF255
MNTHDAPGPDHAPGPAHTAGPDHFAHLATAGRATQAEVMRVPEEAVRSEPGSLSDLATKVVFGDLWNRPGLSVRERRIITLTVLAMLQSHQIHGHLHVKAALDSGDLTEAELREVAVQIAYYAGWPVATSFEWTVDKATGKTSGVEDL